MQKSGTSWDLNGFASKTELLSAFRQMSEVILLYKIYKAFERRYISSM